MFPSEIEEAISLLRDAEKTKNPKEKIRDFEEGFEIIDTYLKENPSIPEAILKRINNTKKSYSRVLLAQLPACMGVDIGTWIECVKIMAVYIKNEIEEVKTEVPTLRDNEDAFLQLWKDEIINLLIKQNRL